MQIKDEWEAGISYVNNNIWDVSISDNQTNTYPPADFKYYFCIKGCFLNYIKRRW